MRRRQLLEELPLDHGGGDVMCVDWSSDAKYFAAGLANGILLLYNAKTWELISIRKDRKGRLTCVKFSPASELIAVSLFVY